LKRFVSVLVFFLFLINCSYSLTYEIWNTNEECNITADRTDADKIIIANCNINVNAFWNVHRVNLTVNNSAGRHDIHINTNGFANITYLNYSAISDSNDAQFYIWSGNGSLNISNSYFNFRRTWDAGGLRFGTYGASTSGLIPHVYNSNFTVQSMDIRDRYWVMSNVSMIASQYFIIGGQNINFTRLYGFSSITSFSSWSTTGTIYGYINMSSSNWGDSYIQKRSFPFQLYNDTDGTNTTKVMESCDVSLWRNGTRIDTELSTTNSTGGGSLTAAFTGANRGSPFEFHVRSKVLRSGLTFDSDTIEYGADGELVGFAISGASICDVPFDIQNYNTTWYVTNDNTPNLYYRPWGPNAAYACELFIGGIGYGFNSTVINNTVSYLTANVTLIDGNYSMYVNCSDGTYTYQSEASTLTLETVAPSIYFTGQTPENNTITLNKSVSINVSISEAGTGLQSFTLVWNNTNYTLIPSFLSTPITNIVLMASPADSIVKCNDSLFFFYLSSINSTNPTYEEYGVQYNLTTSLWGLPLKIADAHAGVLGDKDTHNYPSVKADSNGIFHMVYGAHATPLYYKKSNYSCDISTWSPEKAIYATFATYPRIRIGKDNSIYVIFRSENNISNDAHLGITLVNSSDSGTTWSSKRIVSMATTNFWTVPLGFDIDSNDTLSVAWSIGDQNEALARFYGIYYIKSVDKGITWKSANDTVFTLPIGNSSFADLNVVYRLNYSAKELLVNSTGAVHILGSSAWYTTAGSDTLNTSIFTWNGSAWKENIIGNYRSLYEDSNSFSFDSRDKLYAYIEWYNTTASKFEITEAQSSDLSTWTKKNITFEHGIRVFDSIWVPERNAVYASILRDTGTTVGLYVSPMLGNHTMSLTRYNSTEYRFFGTFNNLSNGNYTYTGYARDNVGNINTTETRWVIVSTVTPTTTPETTTTSTTPATTTTSSSSTTSTTIPGTLPSNSTLYIFSILAPIFATIFTLAAIFGGNRFGIISSIFASTLWYVSDMWSTRIRFVGDFTVSASTHYVDAGNWEIGIVFLAFAGIMSVYTVVLILDFLYSNNKQNG
jgi:hypothetical protein